MNYRKRIQRSESLGGIFLDEKANNKQFSFEKQKNKLKSNILFCGGSRFLHECDQKRDQTKSKALERYFRKFRRNSKTRNVNLYFFLFEQLRWLPLKWLILRQNETQHTCLIRGLTLLIDPTAMPC